MQTTVCMAEYFTTAGYFYKTSTSAIEFVSKQPKTVNLFRSFELAYQCMEMLNKHLHALCSAGSAESAHTSTSQHILVLCSAESAHTSTSLFWFSSNVAK